MEVPTNAPVVQPRWARAEASELRADDSEHMALVRGRPKRDEAVLVIVKSIPRGRLVSYGDIAAMLSQMDVPCTPRQVASTLSRYGGAVPWWRVVQAAGSLAAQVAEDATRHLRAEGVEVRGRRVPLSALRWQPDVEALQAEVLDKPDG